MSTPSINELDERIRYLRSQLDGVQGAVLRETDRQGFEYKQQQLQATIRQYYQALFGDRVSIP